jgi:AcrR family transcriptional regulator
MKVFTRKCQQESKQSREAIVTEQGPTKLLKRPQRRRALISAAATAFARAGFAATSLDDVAAEAGVSRVLIYRHFDSKTQLYEAVIEDIREELKLATGHPDHEAPASLEALVTVARDNPAGFRLFFRQAGQEPEFRRHADELRAAMTETAEPYLRAVLHDDQAVRWASRLIPTIAIEAVIAWLDADQPAPPATAAATIAQIIGGTVSAIATGAVPHEAVADQPDL